MDLVGVDVVIHPGAPTAKKELAILVACHTIIGEALAQGSTPNRCRRYLVKRYENVEILPTPAAFKAWPMTLTRKFVPFNGRLVNVWLYRVDMWIAGQKGKR